jgi:hypothetical protein
MSSFYRVIFGLILLQANLSFSQGKINMNGATMNVKNSAYVVTKDVSLTSASTLNIDSSTIKIAGIISNAGIFDVTKGTVEMNGSSSQTIPLNAFFTNKIKNLIISNDVTLAGQDSLTGILSFGALNSKTFLTAGFLTLKSSATGTASVADLTNNDVNSGNQVLDSVIVERYIPATKKWRFLSIPTSTTQTIKKAWQEGSNAPNDNLTSGFGTQITGAGGTAAGFDVYTATPSMKTYYPATNGWLAIPNTNSTLINNPTNNTIAYFVFVRGDRSATAFNSPVSPTVLRTKGVIKQGNQADVTIASPATAFTAVGNPYPSRIDLLKMTPTPTTATKIYVWDPIATIGSANGLGAYQTLTYISGTGFTVTPGGGSYGAPYNRNPNYIESGEAFLVGGNAAAYNITFKEDIKPSVNNLVSRTYGHPQTLKANLFINKNGVTSLMDGIRADIGTNFSNDLDDDDAYKMGSSSETVSLKRNGKLLSVERHNSITANDTFYLNSGNMRVQNYQWQLDMDNMDQPGLTGFLEDNYTHTSTPLNLNGSTIVNFNTENISGSYAADRFRIVFTPALVLPLSFTSIKAYRNNEDIAVDWRVENESNLKQYDVQKSVDGNHYATANTVAANNAILSNYNWLDVNPSKGYNYYRIKSVDINGKMEYSKVVKVLIGTIKQAITVYPNPVIDGIIHLQFMNQLSGTYEVRLLNNEGQIISSKQIQHTEGSSTETLLTDKDIHGIYHLEITQPDNKQISIKILLY